MSIVTEKKFLTTEELQTLKTLQNETQALVVELGEIELTKIQLDKRYENAKTFLNDLGTKEQEFTQSVFEKYGKVSIDPSTGDISPME
jgi:ribosome-binding ATPase YchF (GTP1/OBG family)